MGSNTQYIDARYQALRSHYQPPKANFPLKKIQKIREWDNPSAYKGLLY